MLAARALRAVGEPMAALELAKQVSRSRDPVVAYAASLIAASAYLQFEQHDEAASLLRRSPPPKLSAETRAERAYYEALLAWQTDRLDEAQAIVESQLHPRDGVFYARGIDLLGWIEFARHRYGIAARHFLKVTDALGGPQVRDEFGRVCAIAVLSTIAVETLDLRLERDIAALRETIPAHDGSLSRSICEIDQNLAEIALLRGDVQQCHDRYSSALAQAPSDALRLTFEVALARLFRLHGQAIAQRLHLERARRLLAAVRWSAADVEDRMAPLLLAAEAAFADPALAANSLARALPASRRVATDAVEGDARASAMAYYARGRVAAQKGLKDAEALLRRAADIWDGIGYTYRRAVVAIDLFKLTHARDELEPLSAAAKVAPSSWLATELSILKRMDSPISRLNPAELRVLEGLRTGQTGPQIAEAVGRSPHTIRNQTARIFKVLGVNTRAALVVRLLEYERGTRPT